MSNNRILDKKNKHGFLISEFEFYIKINKIFCIQKCVSNTKTDIIVSGNG